MREVRGDGEDCPDDGRDIQTEGRGEDDTPVARDVSDGRMGGGVHCNFPSLSFPLPTVCTTAFPVK